MVPITYASNEGSDEPAHPRKIASAMQMKVHALILGNIAPLSGCEFKNGKSRHLGICSIYHPSVDVCTTTLLHAKISLRIAQSYQHLCF